MPFFYVLATLRHVSLPLMELVKKELQRMENKGVTKIPRFCNQSNKFLSLFNKYNQAFERSLELQNQWLWGETQQKAFTKTKMLLSSIPVLALYHQRCPTIISADASSFGLGAVLMQQHSNNQWRLVAYASRVMTLTKQRYAQVEKEALAVTWACERFIQYLLGLSFKIILTIREQAY